MPSFLDRLTGRAKKRDESTLPSSDSATAAASSSKETTTKASSLHLEPPSSPRSMKSKSKSTDALSSFFRSTSPPTSPTRASLAGVAAPRLDVTLPLSSATNGFTATGTNGKIDAPSSDEFGRLFVEDDHHVEILSDEELDRRTLEAPDVIKLVIACSTVIHAQGLETLGLFHAQWYSASRESQRALISRFLHSLKSSDAKGISAFQAELRAAQPQDVAAVLKWGLRHLETDSETTFAGKTPTLSSSSPGIASQWAWYTVFAEKERESGFPKNAFSTILIPELPPNNGKLLTQLLELFSSVAAHAEGNGMFSAKLPKVMSWWIISSRRWSGSSSSWPDFYRTWTECSRIMEHVFLCYLRDQSTQPQGLPLRLDELHQPYPPESGALDPSDPLRLPPPPQLATRSLNVLHIRLQSPYGAQKRAVRDDPTLLLEEAFRAELKLKESASPTPGRGIWSSLKEDVDKYKAAAAARESKDLTATSITEEEPALTATDTFKGIKSDVVDLFADASHPSVSILTETSARWLRLAAPSDDSSNKPVFDIPTLVEPPSFYRRRSFSLGDRGLSVLHEDGVEGLTQDKAPVHTKSATDEANRILEQDETWKSFSSSGFGESGGLASSLVPPTLDLDPSGSSPTRKSSISSTNAGRRSFASGGSTFRGRSKSSNQPYVYGTSSGAGRPSIDSVLSVSGVGGVTTSPSSPTAATGAGPVEDVAVIVESPAIVQIDEAFVDTWADTLLDRNIRPVKRWPNFALYELKTPRPLASSGSVGSKEVVEWLVVEQYVSRTAPPVPGGDPNSATTIPRSPREGSLTSVRTSRSSVLFKPFASGGFQRFGLFRKFSSGTIGDGSFSSSRKSKGSSPPTVSGFGQSSTAATAAPEAAGQKPREAPIAALRALEAEKAAIGEPTNEPVVPAPAAAAEVAATTAAVESKEPATAPSSTDPAEPSSAAAPAEDKAEPQSAEAPAAPVSSVEEEKPEASEPEVPKIDAPAAAQTAPAPSEEPKTPTVEVPPSSSAQDDVLATPTVERTATDSAGAAALATPTPASTSALAPASSPSPPSNKVEKAHSIAETTTDADSFNTATAGEQPGSPPNGPVPIAGAVEESKHEA